MSDPSGCSSFSAATGESNEQTVKRETGGIHTGEISF